MVDYNSFTDFISRQSAWSVDVFEQTNKAFVNSNKGRELELEFQFADLTDIINKFAKVHSMTPTVMCFLFGRLIDTMIQMHEDDMIDEGIIYDSDEDGAIVIGSYLNTVLYGIALSLKTIEKDQNHD
jgi:hypothetical protein